jgi:hypothetical protein
LDVLLRGEDTGKAASMEQDVTHTAYVLNCSPCTYWGESAVEVDAHFGTLDNEMVVRRLEFFPSPHEITHQRQTEQRIALNLGISKQEKRRMNLTQYWLLVDLIDECDRRRLRDAANPERWQHWYHAAGKLEAKRSTFFQ